MLFYLVSVYKKMPKLSKMHKMPKIKDVYLLNQLR